MSEEQAKYEIWCEQHNHYKRTCPHCEITELEEQLQSAQQRIKELSHFLKTDEATIEKYQQRELKLIEGLRFYADEKTYDMRHLDLHGYLVIDQDGGNKAKAVLKELGVTE